MLVKLAANQLLVHPMVVVHLVVVVVHLVEQPMVEHLVARGT